MSEREPTPADEYPIVRDELVELPSGAAALVRQPSLFMLLRRGLVPPEVRAIIEKLQAGDEADEAEMLTLLDFLVAASYVSPKVAFKRRKGALCIDDIPDDDRLAVVSRLGLREAV